MRKLIIFLFVIILSGCATTTGTTIITGQERPSIDPSEVTLFLTPPSQYETIGLIEASSEVTSTRQAAQDRVINELRSRAARIGANGLILTSTGTEAGATVGQFIGGVFIAGTTQIVSTQAIAIYVILD